MNKDTKRELTPDEVKRNEYYENQKAELEKEGYTVCDLTTSVVKSNVMAVLIVLPLVVIFSIIYIVVNKAKVSDLLYAAIHFESFLLFLLFWVSFFLLIILHELIHGVSRAACAKSGWKAISFGFIKKYMTPYCTCNEPLTKFGYIFGAMMPAIVLGFIPAIVAIAIGNTFIFYVSMLMILAGGGDMFTTCLLITFKSKGKKSIYIDHPYLVGLTAFVKE
jgi:hypothetical protein